MDEEKAEAVAEALGGETWEGGGGRWLVLFRREDGRLTVLSERSACEYDTWDDFDGGRASRTLPFV